MRDEREREREREREGERERERERERGRERKKEREREREREMKSKRERFVRRRGRDEKYINMLTYHSILEYNSQHHILCKRKPVER